MFDYFASLSKGKTILWCYLIWYLVIVVFYFDPHWRIWLNSAGISAIIGFALVLSVSGGNGERMDRWQVFRLFAMPFCVSSFSSLIKGQGFLLVVPPRPLEQAVAIGACAGFVALLVVIKRLRQPVMA